MLHDEDRVAFAANAMWVLFLWKVLKIPNFAKGKKTKECIHLWEILPE